MEIVPVLRHRNLLAFTGSLEEVRQQISAYDKETELIALGEIIVNEDTESLERRQAFEALVNEQPNPILQIVKSRLVFKNRIRGASDAFAVGTDVAGIQEGDLILSVNGKSVHNYKLQEVIKLLNEQRERKSEC